MLFQQARPRLAAQLTYKRLVLSHFAQNLLAMIVKIRKSRMHLPQRQMRQALDNLLRASPMNFRLRINILHPHASSFNKRSRLPIPIRANLNMSGNCLNHF